MTRFFKRSTADRFFDWKMRIFDRRAHAAHHSLMAAQALSRDALQELNWERRVAMVEHCARTIPYYQRVFSEIGFEPGDLRTEADWVKLPVLEKEDIRACANALLNPAYSLSDLPVATTGGTTGQPLKTYNDPDIHLSSMSWRMLDWWDIHPADNSGYLYRAVPKGLSKQARDIALWPTRRAYIAASDMSEVQMGRFLADLYSTKPRYLVGYVGALEVFARFCQARGAILPSLAAIWTTASPLSEAMRAYIEEVFQAPAYTQYGSCEFYWIAAECSHQHGMHIGSDIRHVEILGEDTKDCSESFGDLLVTDLQNCAFPLLRYRLGDRGRLLDRSCGCGLPFPLMDYVRGRISDALRLHDGTWVPGEFWTTIFDDFTSDVDAFQVVQKLDGSIHVSYVAEPSDAANMAAATVLARLRSQTGMTEVQMHRVEAIPHREGKLQIVVRERGGIH